MIWGVLAVISIGVIVASSFGNKKRQISSPRPVRRPLSGTAAIRKRPSSSVGVARRATRNGGMASSVIKSGSYPSRYPVTTASIGASTQEKTSCIDALLPDPPSSGSNKRQVSPRRSDRHPMSSTVAIPAELIASVDDAVRTALKWVGAGSVINVGPFQISDPFTYVSNGPISHEEASCINARLPVGSFVPEERGALGYWPRYSQITPDQRANYIFWLAGGRNAELADIWYAFIFFYGLERRALVDNKDIETVLTLANRLMYRYSASRSFFGYASRFIAFVLARVGLENLPRESFDVIFEQSIKEFDDETLAVALAWLFKMNTPLPPSLAFEVARNDIRASRSVVVARVADHFRALFFKKYAARYEEGLILKSSARARLIEYNPASPTVLYALSGHAPPVVRIPNVLGLSSQFKPLVEMWQECIEELKPLSREVGKGRDVLTRQAYQALPDVLKAEVDHPDKGKWEQFVAANTIDSNIVIASVGDLAALCGFERRPRLTARQSEDLVTTAANVGFVLVPDVRIIGRSYKWDDMVAVFRSEGIPEVPTDSKYRAAILMLEMGMAVAAADGAVDQDEVDQIIGFLKGQFLLAPYDARRIDAYKAILVKHPPSLSNLAKRLQSSLTAEHLETVCQFLVGIAAANGSIDKGERITLRRFYTALGLPTSKLDDVIAKLLGTVPGAVEIQLGVVVPGEKIPERPAQAVFTLNAAALQTILQETEQVAQMLGDALSASAEEDAEVVIAEVQRASASPIEPLATPVETADSSPSCVFPGLDMRYHIVVAELLSRDAWAPEDFESMDRKHNVMPAGMLEAINAWSDENHGDFLIEEGESFTINRTLLEKTSCPAQ
jgi:uncharacterized tellurite resistance protein B-like protein